MDDESKMKLMKQRMIKSYAWQRDVIVPLSGEFDCSTEELEELFYDLLDMDSINALHGTFKSAEDICLYQKLNADLRLCWFSETLELISHEDGKELREKLIKEIQNGKSYDDALKEGRLELFQLLKEETKYRK